jgi:heme-degrading monooxygenase HmoA
MARPKKGAVRKMVVAMFHVEVAPGHEERLIEGFRHRAKLVDTMPGFLGFELLRHRDEPNKFLVITRWERYEDFIAWTESEQFRKAHEREGAPTLSTQLALYEVVQL